VSGSAAAQDRAGTPYDAAAARRHTRRVAVGVFAVEIASIVALYVLGRVFGG
jgi:hypothetical protein